MTVKLVALYTQPEDPAEFDRHYFATHMPLVHAIPGLERAETSKFSTAVDGGEKTFYRAAHLYFADQAALETALGTPEAQATSTDFLNIAPPGSRLFIAALDGKLSSGV
jgi:uncharacterized protein (TIGR02118 family)